MLLLWLDAWFVSCFLALSGLAIGTTAQSWSCPLSINPTDILRADNTTQNFGRLRISGRTLAFVEWEWLLNSSARIVRFGRDDETTAIPEDFIIPNNATSLDLARDGNLVAVTFRNDSLPEEDPSCNWHCSHVVRFYERTVDSNNNGWLAARGSDLVVQTKWDYILSFNGPGNVLAVRTWRNYDVAVTVYQYNENSAQWSQLGNEIPTGERGDQSLAKSVLRMAVSHSNGNGRVQIYGYSNLGGNWELEDDLEGDNNESMQFGRSLAMNGDGTVLVVGSIGGVDLLVRNHGNNGVLWSRQASLKPNDPLASDNWFGNSVGISNDGQTVVVGSRARTFNGLYAAGRVYLFKRFGHNTNDDAKQWYQVATMEGSNMDDFLGEYVAIDEQATFIAATTASESDDYLRYAKIGRCIESAATSTTPLPTPQPSPSPTQVPSARPTMKPLVTPSQSQWPSTQPPTVTAESPAQHTFPHSNLFLIVVMLSTTYLQAQC